MKRLGVLCLILSAACSAEDGGEPMDGTITIIVGGDTITPDVGAAIEDPDDATKALIVFGTRDISCSTQLNSALENGTYLTFGIDRAIGAQSSFVSVTRVSGTSADLNGSSGDVVIDSLEDRVTGSVTFDTTDDEVGTISADGTFDVIRCF